MRARTKTIAAIAPMAMPAMAPPPKCRLGFGSVDTNTIVGLEDVMAGVAVTWGVNVNEAGAGVSDGLLESVDIAAAALIVV